MSTTTIQIVGGQTFVIPQVMTQQEVVNTYASLGLASMTCTTTTGAEGSVTYTFSPQTGRKGAATTTIQIVGGQTFVIPGTLSQQEVVNTYASLGLASMTCSTTTDANGNVSYSFSPQTGRKGA